MIVLRIARYAAQDLLRSRWLLAYATFFAVATALLLRFSDAEAKALLSLVTIVLFVVPLANLVYGTVYLYAAREFTELMLAQPIRRLELFAGLGLGLAVPVALAIIAGMGLPLVLLGASRESVGIGLTLAAIAALLGIVFTALAAVIAYRVDDRVRGLATAIGTWLLLAILYDALVLLAAVQLADYPLERPLLGLMLANPIDLARLLLLARFDDAAMLGYTGALFTRAFAGPAGVALAAAMLAIWAALPALAAARAFHRKDF